MRTVQHLIPAERVNMGGIFVKQALPTHHVNQVDPFLLLHHGDFKFNDSAKAIHQGIGPHPHRGFSPVTFVVEGELHHRDSRGHSQIAREGEVQWMHAGAGIVHSERPTEPLVQSNTRQEIIQLWINSPADKKMQPPKYQHLASEDIPRLTSADMGSIIKVIAGEYQGKKGLIETESELLVLWANTISQSHHTYHIPENMNCMLYLIKGQIKIKGYGPIEQEQLIVFNNDGDSIDITTEDHSQFLILCGVPINEKIVQQGPFVMNSETEILEAMRDYQMGKMGVLIEE